MLQSKKTETINFYGITSRVGRETDYNWVNYDVHFDISFYENYPIDAVKIIANEKVCEEDAIYLKETDLSYTHEYNLFQKYAFTMSRELILDTILADLQRLESLYFNFPIVDVFLKPFFVDSPCLYDKRVENIRFYNSSFFQIPACNTITGKSEKLERYYHFDILFYADNNTVTVIYYQEIDSRIMSLANFASIHRSGFSKTNIYSYTFKADLFDENRTFILDTIISALLYRDKKNTLAPFMVNVL